MCRLVEMREDGGSKEGDLGERLRDETRLGDNGTETSPTPHPEHPPHLGDIGCLVLQVVDSSLGPGRQCALLDVPGVQTACSYTARCRPIGRDDVVGRDGDTHRVSDTRLPPHRVRPIPQRLRDDTWSAETSEGE